MILVPLLLIGGTAGTLVVLHDVPFASAKQSGSTGGQGQNLLPAPGRTGATAGPWASASAPDGHKPTTGPSRSSGAAGGATAAVTSKPAAGGGTAGGGITQTSAPAGQTSAAGGGSGGSGSGDPTVVSASYGEIKNVAQADCVDGDAGGTVKSCDGSSTVQFHEVSTSGGFRLVAATGQCLDNAGADVESASCSVFNPSTLVWTIGTRTAQGGQLMNGGQCLAWTTSAMGDLGVVQCNASDPDQLWYDAGT